MLRFPFNARPMPNNSYTEQKEEPLPNNNDQSIEEMPSDTSLSPELSFLLSMVLKDGLKENKTLNMLEDILPFISGTDNQAISNMLQTKSRQASSNYNQLDSSHNHSSPSLSEYSKQSRQQELLNTMQKYAGSDTGDMMGQMQNNSDMFKNFERMSKSMQKFGDMQNASPTDMMEAMSMFMPNQDMSQFKNMQNMMNMMNMMNGKNNLKPEDMLRFMNMNK